MQDQDKDGEQNKPQVIATIGQGYVSGVLHEGALSTSSVQLTKEKIRGRGKMYRDKMWREESFDIDILNVSSISVRDMLDVEKRKGAWTCLGMGLLSFIIASTIHDGVEAVGAVIFGFIVLIIGFALWMLCTNRAIAINAQGVEYILSISGIDESEVLHFVGQVDQARKEADQIRRDHAQVHVPVATAPGGSALGCKDRLVQLKELKEAGLISEDEFEEKRRAIVREI